MRSVPDMDAIEERRFVIGGRRLALRSADPAMLDALTRALGHLETLVDQPAQLTINLWHSADTDSAPPQPDILGEQAPGAFFYWSDERARVGYTLGTSGDARVLEVYKSVKTPTLSVLDAEAGEGWYWVQDRDLIPYWEMATPLRYLLDWWLRDEGLHMLHAGAVGADEGGLIIVGKSGSGKSTTTLSSLATELRYAGDDYVGVSIEPQPWVHGLYGSGKLMPDHVTRLPFLLPAISNPGQLATEKAVIFVREHWPTSMTSGFPLRAVVVPRLVPQLVEARVQRISAMAALAALAPSTVFQMHTRGKDSLTRMARLVSVVPSFALDLGSDIASISKTLSDLVSELNEQAKA